MVLVEPMEMAETVEDLVEVVVMEVKTVDEVEVEMKVKVVKKVVEKVEKRMAENEAVESEAVESEVMVVVTTEGDFGNCNTSMKCKDFPNM